MKNQGVDRSGCQTTSLCVPLNTIVMSAIERNWLTQMIRWVIPMVEDFIFFSDRISECDLRLFFDKIYPEKSEHIRTLPLSGVRNRTVTAPVPFSDQNHMIT